MASTNKTTVLDLSQFVGSDIPGWLTDYNSDMSNIDAFASEAKSDISGAVQTANSANTTAQAASTAANQAVTAANQAVQSVSGLQTSINSIVNGWKTADSANPNPSVFTAYLFNMKYNQELGLIGFIGVINFNSPTTIQNMKIATMPLSIAPATGSYSFRVRALKSGSAAMYDAYATIASNGDIVVQSVDNETNYTAIQIESFISMAGAGGNWPAITT